MKKGLLKLVTLSVLVVTLASCAKVPQADIDAANVDAQKSGLAQVEEQNAKFALFRNYDVAKTTLVSVTTLSNKAVEETTARKEALKAEVTAAVTELTASIAANKELLAKAPKGKEGKAAVEAIGQEIGVVETVLTEVSAGLTNNDDILTLSEKVKPAVEKAKAINTELTDVIAKAKGPKAKAAKAPAAPAAKAAAPKAAKKK